MEVAKAVGVRLVGLGALLVAQRTLRAHLWEAGSLYAVGVRVLGGYNAIAQQAAWNAAKAQAHIKPHKRQARA